LQCLGVFLSEQMQLFEKISINLNGFSQNSLSREAHRVYSDKPLSRDIMKLHISTLVLLLSISGCSIFSANNQSIGVKDQRLATDFTDEGVKLFYTLGGILEKIEVYGQADVWKGNVDILAEADAYTKLVKFIHGSNVRSDRTIKLLGRAMEKAEDSSSDRSNGSDSALITSSNELDIEERGNRPSPERSKNAQLSARTINKTLVDTITNITSNGRLTGIRKVRDSQSNNGRTYIAVYQWSEKDQSTIEALRTRINSKE
jgi:hypothetical protein